MDQDAVIGKLVREYLENERRLASLGLQIRQIGASLQDFGGRLASNPQRAHSTPSGLDGGSETGVPVPLDALEQARELLDEYHAALDAKAQMEQDLRKMGLDSVIQD